MKQKRQKLVFSLSYAVGTYYLCYFNEESSSELGQASSLITVIFNSNFVYILISRTGYKNMMTVF